MLTACNKASREASHFMRVDYSKIKFSKRMLLTIAVLLIVLWLLGLVTSYTLGGFIHLLLLIAIVVVLIRVIRGQNPL